LAWPGRRLRRRSLLRLACRGSRHARARRGHRAIGGARRRGARARRPRARRLAAGGPGGGRPPARRAPRPRSPGVGPRRAAPHPGKETGRARGEFARVVRPGGRIVVKESQLLHGAFLPGHPALERRLRQAEMEWSRHEGGEFSFEERRQRTLASVRAAGLSVESFRTYLLERRAPLPYAARDYIQHVVFERNWGPRP